MWTHDPDGMGSTVGAPEDEYEGFAGAMLAALKDADSEAVASYLRERFPAASSQLVADCIAAIRRFQHRTESVS
jgi:hypothetical protein